MAVVWTVGKRLSMWQAGEKRAVVSGNEAISLKIFSIVYEGKLKREKTGMEYYYTS